MRRVCLGLGMLLVSGLLVWQVQRGGFRLPLFDFVEYWAAGRLNLEGHNPYDPDAVHELEKAAGRAEPGVLMWNPPWSLPFVMPFGLLEVHTAHLLWLLLQFIALPRQRDVVIPKLIELRLLDSAFDIKEESAVAFGVESRLFRWNISL